MSKFQLWEAIVTLLDTTGEAAVLISDEVVGGVPAALWPIHRKNMELLKNGSGWNVIVNGIKRFVPNEQVIFNKYYNPFDERRGLSPIRALKLSLDSEWGAVNYNQSFFEKGSTIGAVYQTDEHLNDDAFTRLKQELITARQGANSMHQALLLDGGVKLSNTRPSNRDLEFLELRKFTREEVAMVFKVPKPELSLYEDINYATAQSADLSFWKKTLIPLMRQIEDQFNQAFLYNLGFKGHFDVSAIDALNSEILQKAEAAKEFFGIGFSRNQINERLNLGFAVKDDDVISPLFMAPVVQESFDPSVKALQIREGEMNQAEILKGLRDAKWKSLMAPILPIMGRAKRGVTNYFFDVEQRLYKQANKAFSGAVIKAVDDLDTAWVDDAFNDERLKKILEPIIEEAVVLGVGVNMIPDEAILAQVAKRGSKITGINDTARDRVIKAVQVVLEDAIKEGWTELERAEAINEAIKTTMGTAKKNARTIARTETHGAYEEGRFEGIKSTNPQKKMWLSSRDGEVRESHMIDGETVPFDEDFSNGLEHPMDPAGSAEDVINCRCTWVPVYE